MILSNMPNYNLTSLIDSLNDPFAIAGIVGGAIALFWGWRFFRIFIFFAGAMVGIYCGEVIASYLPPDFFGSADLLGYFPLILGALFAFSALPYIRYALFMLAGFGGGYALYLMGLAMFDGDYRHYFAIAGFVVCGVFSLAFFEVIIVIGTSILGASTIITCGLYFLNNLTYQQTAMSRISYYDFIASEYAWAIPLALVLIAILGMLIQMKLLPQGGIKKPQKKIKSEKD